MKRVLVIDNGSYRTKCAIIHYNPLTGDRRDESRSFPTALRYKDGEYSLIDEDNGDNDIVRYFRGFFGMSLSTARTRVGNYFPYFAVEDNGNTFPAMSVPGQSRPVSCMELTSIYMKKIYEEMLKDGPIDCVFVAIPPEFNRDDVKMYEAKLTKKDMSKFVFVPYSDLILKRNDRIPTVAIEAGASNTTVMLLKDRAVKTVQSFAIASGYYVDSEIAKCIQKKMLIKIKQPNRTQFVNSFLLLAAERIRKELNTSPRSSVDLTAIRPYITCMRNSMEFSLESFADIVNNLKSDLDRSVDSVLQPEGLQLTDSEIILSGGLFCQKFAVDVFRQYDSADARTQKDLFTLHQLIAYAAEQLRNHPDDYLQNTPVAAENSDVLTRQESLPGEPSPSPIPLPPQPRASMNPPFTQETIALSQIPTFDNSIPLPTPMSFAPPSYAPARVEIPEVAVVPEPTAEPPSFYPVDLPPSAIHNSRRHSTPSGQSASGAEEYEHSPIAVAVPFFTSWFIR